MKPTKADAALTLEQATSRQIKCENIIPLCDFKTEARQVLERLDNTGDPMILTVNGKTAAVFLTAAEYDRLRELADIGEAVRT